MIALGSKERYDLSLYPSRYSYVTSLHSLQNSLF